MKKYIIWQFMIYCLPLVGLLVLSMVELSKGVTVTLFVSPLVLKLILSIAIAQVRTESSPRVNVLWLVFIDIVFSISFSVIANVLVQDVLQMDKLLISTSVFVLFTCLMTLVFMLLND